MASDYVWTVRDPNGEVVGISAHGREAALRDARECDHWRPRHERALNAFFEYQGWRVQRDPLTPSPALPVVTEAMVTQYTLGNLDDRDTRHRAIRVEYAGNGRWAVRRLGMSLGTDGKWDYEPQPSSRDDAYLAAYRFPSAQAALTAASEATGGRDNA